MIWNSKKKKKKEYRKVTGKDRIMFKSRIWFQGERMELTKIVIGTLHLKKCLIIYSMLPQKFK